ncbi:MAG: hypothetical protein DIU61_014785 [Bacteroidota bacterium]
MKRFRISRPPGNGSGQFSSAESVSSIAVSTARPTTRSRVTPHVQGVQVPFAHVLLPARIHQNLSDGPFVDLDEARDLTHSSMLTLLAFSGHLSS